VKVSAGHDIGVPFFFVPSFWARKKKVLAIKAKLFYIEAPYPKPSIKVNSNNYWQKSARGFILNFKPARRSSHVK